MQVDAQALERSLQGLSERAEGGPLADALALCAQTAVRLFGVTGAGLMLLDDAAELRSAAVTDAPSRALEALQISVDEGPCVDALRKGERVEVEDLRSDPRWPRLQSGLGEVVIGAVLAAPVRLAGAPVGSVNVYRDVPDVWSESAGPALEAYADVVEGVLVGALRSRQQSDIVRQLRDGVNDRVTIERAVGLVMGRDRVDAVTAFNRLRRVARDARRPMADVATQLLRDAVAEGS